ncbi:sn-glycerol-3-phosphate ABC transporter ATP-binding protein UgpC [Phormidesmis priestleyi ULC007]|uniref:sn-glycerol-3-phosphate ABC transporter ATP-binding protein UgpC n=1 Tax=Phormidesmis priestleyi ULC007 TaxID=1920490 RepID=A0A2T1DIT7_9CYAN|nr:sn-glycerol-3-phosphate ABC transporter ATP-binding protein UgpC [Phormidesmis priestleyi]PSB20375.1 sn-glycerol-3-phosphate ABC transporter ATP-binding protein UgpC [Phormidesmis priestleyi ULC007]PZO52952.1 MAG: sn-glycerol-3-phosphate ABC transporter ATP-binding protein UgpC [Phormidesmis priestleyi]
MATIKFQHVFKVYPNGYTALKDLSLEIEDGEFLVFVGPSGCGKSTALRLLAGLEEISAGKLMIGDRIVNDNTPQQRNVAMVFQNYALYPHMSVRQNLEFPLRMMQLPKHQRQARIQEAAERLGLVDLLDRKPKQLSGGQRQRVAMGRAIVRDPAVFLMDEPLSNLDAKMRSQIRTDITMLQRRMGTTTVYVTHDQVEAMTMGDRVAVMRAGELQQVAPPQDLYDHPANIFVASFMGSPAMNLFRTRLQKLESGTFMINMGDRPLIVNSSTVNRYQNLEHYYDQPLLAGLRPEAFFLPDANTPVDQCVQVEVISLEALGHELLIYAKAPATLTIEDNQAVSITNNRDDPDEQMSSVLIARVPSSRNIHPDTRLSLGVDTSKLYFFAVDGKAIE